MAVRFVIGRAGSGKTYRCVEAIRAAVRENAVDGPRLILLVPEQAGLQMERSIIRPPDVVAAHRVEVLSFRRLAYRVLESVHTPSPAAAGAPKSPPTHAIEGIAPPTSADTPPRDANAPPASGVAPSPHVTDRSGGPIAAWRRRRALSEPARAMVLQHLVAARSSELRYYRRVDRFTGFFDRLAATIAELIQEGVVPDAVSEAADRGDGDTAGAAADPVQRAKLHDVGLIYRAYVDYLGDDRLDPSQYLQAARDGLAQCDWVDGAHLWVDGFASLMWQEVATLVALARRCAAVEITVLMDPGMVDVRGGASAAAHRLFAKTYRTYDDLRRALLDAGLDVAEPVLLAERRCPRFARSAALDRLERGLFEPGAARDGADAEAAADVSVVALPSRRVEAAYAASLIRRWVRDASTAHRYRDIALIVRDLEPYHDLMSSALRAAGIPFFIDRRRPTAHHPLVEWLRSVTAMASDGMSPTSVRGALKTDLFPITTDAADELENYVIARGVAGVDAWRGGDWSAASRRDYGGAADTPSAYESAALARINHARRVLIDAVGPWLEVATGGALTGAAWSGALVSLMQRLGVERRLEAWALEAAGAGDLDLAEEHRQVWRDTIAFLDDLAFALQDVRLGVGDFSRVLEAGLSRFTLGLAPPMLDQVLVGSIERSRHPEIKAAIIVGFNDGAFPRPATEDAILNDDDRALLERAGVRIGPPARRRTLDESLLLYVAATRACASLVFTYAAADNDGKQLRVSPYVDAVRAACPGLGVTRIDDPARTRDMWDILAPADAVRRLAMEFRGRGPLEDDDAPARGRWNELYDAIRPDAARTTAWRRAMASLSERNAASLSAASVQRLYGDALRTSVSRLETFASCPFQHFLRYGLDLRERAVADLLPVDIGSVHHAILDDFVGALARARRRWAELSDADVLGGLADSCARVSARWPADGMPTLARDAYVLQRTWSHLARVLLGQRAVARAGTATPRATELAFGFSDKPGGLPALVLATRGGRRVVVRGYIDRVDIVELADEALGIVIDYKHTRDKRLDMSRVYHGLSLQLLAYLLALADHGQTLAGRPIRPIGALYVGLVPRYRSVDDPSEPDGPRDALPGVERPRGVLRFDELDALEPGGGDAGWCTYYSVYRKKDGGLGNADKSDAVDGPGFRALLDHTRDKLGELADAVLDGDVGVRPCRLGTFSPCSWCTLSSVCRFEMDMSDVRFLETLKQSDVIQRVQAVKRGEATA